MNTYTQVSDNRFYCGSVEPFLGNYITKNKPVQQRYMFVYKIVCKPTNEVYFGQHVCQPCVTNPFNDHYKGSGHRLAERKKQYNWHSDFKFYILQFCHNNAELDLIEQMLIRQAREQGIACLNVELNRTVRRRTSKPSAPKGRPIVNIYPFISPLNGVYFPAYTKWQSLKIASKAVGFKNCQQFTGAMFDRLKPIPGEWTTILQNRDEILVTRFVYEDELEFRKEELEQYIGQHKTIFEANVAICQRYAKDIELFGSCRVLININKFISPFNGAEIESGTIFKTIYDVRDLIGFTNACTATQALRSSLHHNEWWTVVNSKPKFVAKFMTPTELGLETNDSSFIQQKCDELWQQYKSDIEIRESHFKRTNVKHKIRVAQTFVSHMNNKEFKEGHVFASTSEAARELGFKSHATIRDVIMKNNGQLSYSPTGKTKDIIRYGKLEYV